MNIRPPPWRCGAHDAISLEKRAGTWLAISRKTDARSNARFSSRRPHGAFRAAAPERTRKIIASGSDTSIPDSEAAPASSQWRRFTV